MNLHSKHVWLGMVATGLFASGLVACGSGEHEAAKPAAEPQAAQPAAAPDAGIAPLRERAKAIFGVLPKEATSQENPVTPEKITLGRMLFYEPRLTLSETQSCNSCHLLDHYGVDGEPTSKGHEGKRGERNAPTVYNAAFQIAQFWDGRAANVEEQAKGPALNPIEMAMPSEAEVLARLKSIPGYAPLFAAAFPDAPDPITFDNMARAIGAFERRLVTPGPLDAFLEGDDSALTPAQRAGLAKFMDTGCITCHNGATVGGRMFQKLGLVEPYPTKDVGREKVTGNEADRYVFKVPVLRNVAKTGPWFHDGSLTNLDQVIRTMARYQLGKQLSDEDVASIHSFLEALTGQVDEAYVARPELPANADGTPAPGAS
jgi:cytochrome c peroxidase